MARFLVISLLLLLAASACEAKSEVARREDAGSKAKPEVKLTPEQVQAQPTAAAWGEKTP